MLSEKRDRSNSSTSRSSKRVNVGSLKCTRIHPQLYIFGDGYNVTDMTFLRNPFTKIPNSPGIPLQDMSYAITLLERSGQGSDWGVILTGSLYWQSLETLMVTVVTYFDIANASHINQLFPSDFAIFKDTNPPPATSLLCLHFDFKMTIPDFEQIKTAFFDSICFGVKAFVEKYDSFLNLSDPQPILTLCETHKPAEALKAILDSSLS
ncbi:hypothetical protein EDD85DRAFT_70182 [Armillaria nabsnona]|nr:hypothetical protein EDD85DRAFT_70182 [Armillaria nabsnona]